MVVSRNVGKECERVVRMRLILKIMVDMIMNGLWWLMMLEILVVIGVVINVMLVRISVVRNMVLVIDF